MRRRAAVAGKSTAGSRTRRQRVEHDAVLWTVEEPLPMEFPAMNFVYRRWAEPLDPTLTPKIYVAGDDASRGLQYRACLRRAQMVARRVPTPTVFEDCTTRFSGLEALVRNATPKAIIIFSTMARRTAGDRIEALKLALVDRRVSLIEVPEWYLGFEDLRRAPWTPKRRARSQTSTETGSRTVAPSRRRTSP